MKNKVATIPVTAGLLALSLLSVTGTSRHWDGSAGTNWTTIANWSNNVAPVAGDLLLFRAGAANRTNFNNFANGFLVGNIDVAASSYVFSGNRISLTNGIQLRGGLSASAINATFHQSITLSGNQTFLSTAGSLGSARLTVRGAIDLNNAILNIDGNETTELAGAILGPGAVRKAGTGTLLISGDTTFVGPLQLEGGTARVDGVLANAAVEAVSGVTGHLSGTGRVHGILESVALSPGNNGPGRLTSTTYVYLSTGGGLSVDLDGTTAASEYDQLLVIGEVGLGFSSLEVSLGFQPQLGDIFIIIDNDGTDSIAAQFNGLVQGAVFSTNGYSFQISYAGGDGNDAVLTVVRLPNSPIGIWDGDSIHSFWSIPANWVGDVAPTAGQHLRFPATFDKTITNDFVTGTAFASLHFSANNYALHGNAIALTGGITNIAPPGNSTCHLSLAISAPLPVRSDNSVLSLAGPITGNGGIVKHGLGDLWLVGTLNNTYAGDTVVQAGALRLIGVPGRTMVPGPLVIGDGVGFDRVYCHSVNQFASGVPVTIHSSGVLHLNGYYQIIGPLNLDGGNVMTEGGTLGLGGNVVSTASATVASISGQVDLTEQNIGFNVADGPPASDLVIAADISDGGVTKLGPGTLELSGNNGYASPTTVNSGRLLVNGSQAFSPTTFNGGILGGIGTIGPLTANSGVVAPGVGTGRLTVGGNTILSAAITFLVELNGLVGGASYDQLSVNGTVNLAGATLGGTIGFTITPGNAFVIVLNDGSDAITGTFRNLPQGAVFSFDGVYFSISYSGNSGNDVVLTRVVGPSTISSAISLANGQFQFQGRGEANITYSIQASTNLNPLDWLTIGVAPANGMGVFQFLDTDAPLHPMRFYRVQSP